MSPNKSLPSLSVLGVLVTVTQKGKEYVPLTHLLRERPDGRSAAKEIQTQTIMPRAGGVMKVYTRQHATGTASRTEAVRCYEI